MSRLATGMFLVGASFGICALYQEHINSTCSWTTVLKNGTSITLCISEDFSILWMIVPYSVLTIAEVLFAISGLNFTYSQVGGRTKSVSSSLWLLTIALGNLFASRLFHYTENWTRPDYMYFLGAICFGAGGLQLILNSFYTFREKRKGKTLN